MLLGEHRTDEAHGGTASHYYVDTHAAVLRLLAIVIADAGGMPITLCGELAGRESVMPELRVRERNAS